MREGEDIANVLKARRPGRGGRGGVIFSNSRQFHLEDEPDESARLTPSQEPTPLNAISDRFVGHTDQKVDADRHMWVLLI